MPGSSAARVKRIYEEFVRFYPLLDPVEDHRDEVQHIIDTFERVIDGSATTLLELGAGVGNNGYWLKQRFACTLTDLSEAMLDGSRRRNPECRHARGDMRELRLQRRFDAVLVHDAIVYMCTESDLRAAMQTAWLHTRPGGAAIFAPDAVRDTFAEGSWHHEAADGTRALNVLEWAWDPDPHDCTYSVDYACLLREGRDMYVVHERDVEGLFSQNDWLRLLREVGFEPELTRRPMPGGDGAVINGCTDEILVARRPA